MRLRLTLTHQETQDGPTTYVFEQEEVLIGRAAANDLTLEDPSNVVSKQHAKLRVGANGVTLEDLGSKNFTFVRGQRLSAHQPRLLGAGEGFEIGPYHITVDLERAAGRDLEKTVFAAGFTNPFEEAAGALAESLGNLRRSLATSSYPRSDEALLDALRQAMGPGDEVEALHAVVTGASSPARTGSLPTQQPPEAFAPRPHAGSGPASGGNQFPSPQDSAAEPSRRSEDADPWTIDAQFDASPRVDAERDDPFASPRGGSAPADDPFAVPPPDQRPSDDPFAVPPRGPTPSDDPFGAPPRGQARGDDPFAVPPRGADPGADPFAMPPRTDRSHDPFSQPSPGPSPAHGAPPSPSRGTVSPFPAARDDDDLLGRLLQVVTRLIGIPGQFKHEFIGHTILHAPETAFLYDGDAEALRAYLTEGPDRNEHLRLLEEAAEQVVLHQVAMLEGYRAATQAGSSALLDELDGAAQQPEAEDKGVGRLIASMKGGGGTERVREKVAELRSESVSVLERRFFRPAFIDAYLARLANRPGSATSR